MLLIPISGGQLYKNTSKYIQNYIYNYIKLHTITFNYIKHHYIIMGNCGGPNSPHFLTTIICLSIFYLWSFFCLFHILLCEAYRKWVWWCVIGHHSSSLNQWVSFGRKLKGYITMYAPSKFGVCYLESVITSPQSLLEAVWAEVIGAWKSHTLFVSCIWLHEGEQKLKC